MRGVGGGGGARDCFADDGVSMADGRLFVSFSSAVVRSEMALVKEGLMRALNDRVGSAVVKEIIIK